MTKEEKNKKEIWEYYKIEEKEKCDVCKKLVQEFIPFTLYSHLYICKKCFYRGGGG